MTAKRRITRPHRTSRGQRPERSTVHVIGEGAKTEQLYLTGLRRAYETLNVSVAPHQGETDPASLIERGAKFRRSLAASERGEPIWVVFDADVCERGDLDRYVQHAQRHDLRLAISNPCIERWFLMHHEDFNRSTAMMSSATAKSRFEQLFGCNEALSTTVVKRLADPSNRARAIEHADWLTAQHAANGHPDSHNPSSGMAGFLKFLDQLSAATARRT